LDFAEGNSEFRANKALSSTTNARTPENAHTIAEGLALRANPYILNRSKVYTSLLRSHLEGINLDN
jgi:hypothetical protein